MRCIDFVAVMDCTLELKVEISLSPLGCFCRGILQQYQEEKLRYTVIINHVNLLMKINHSTSIETRPLD